MGGHNADIDGRGTTSYGVGEDVRRPEVRTLLNKAFGFRTGRPIGDVGESEDITTDLVVAPRGFPRSTAQGMEPIPPTFLAAAGAGPGGKEDGSPKPEAGGDKEFGG